MGRITLPEICLAALTVMALGRLPAAHGQGTVTTNPPAAESFALPKSVPDPIEPFNRAIWAFNKGLMNDVIKPTSRAYRFVVAKPVRTGIGNLGKNLTYPGRLINNLLQGKWAGARDETHRFVCNTTAGVVGFFDVATKWKIPKSDADFGQTFGLWGWQPQFYLMLPIFGPSNDRDAVGFGADSAANPLLYISPYKLVADNPLTYLGPYSYFNYAVTYNDMSDSVGEFARFSQAEMDPYSEIQFAWTFARSTRAADFQVKGNLDEPSLETLESAFTTYQDPEFPNHGKTRFVRIPATGKNLEFTFWLQPKKAPVVYIVPGLGAHRLATTAIALAELAYQNGYSAVCISSAFHSEFMEHASTADLPAYLPVDGHDVHMALTAVDRRLNALYPDRWGRKAVLGYSMGALHSLYIAATTATNEPPLIKFDRYVAVNTPVRIMHGVAKLDEFYRAPLEWPAAERTDDLENTILKMTALTKGTVAPQTPPPFNAIESKFLVGLAFRLSLRDMIFSSQRRNNRGVLHHAIRNYRRDPVYQEILQYSFQDYFEKFVIPYYQTRGLTAPVAAALEQGGDLHTYAAGLRANHDIRLILNRNDFLLPEADLAWLQATFDPAQISLSEHGGHLGNILHPDVKKAILNALAGLN